MKLFTLYVKLKVKSTIYINSFVQLPQKQGPTTLYLRSWNKVPHLDNLVVVCRFYPNHNLLLVVYPSAKGAA